MREIVKTKFVSLNEFDLMTMANEQRMKGADRFLVFNSSGEVSGVLPNVLVNKAAEQKDLESNVQKYMNPLFEKVDAGMSLKVLIDKFTKNKYTIVPVYEEDVLIGVVNIDAINEFIGKNQRK